MPINVNTLKVNVETLINKQQAGILTGADFNTMLNSAQNLMFEFYRKRFEDTQVIVEALEPFIVQANVAVTGGSYITGGAVEFPSDYVHRLELMYDKIVNNKCEGPTHDAKPVDYMLQNEVAYTLANPIRRPSMENGIFRHTINNGLIKVFPYNIGRVWLKY